VRITSATTYTVGNPWKNWLFVRLETDEGIYGVGEGTANAFAASIETTIHELEDTFIGLDPTQVELLSERMHRDVYTDGGQVHRAAIAAIEIACWDIVGKSVGLPVHALLGGRVRDRVRVYANGWYQVARTPEAMADAARAVVAKGYTALKFDPFGHTSRTIGPDEESLAIDLIQAVRDVIGPRVDLLVEGHCRFGVAQAIRLAQRMAPSDPLWFEEPVPHHDVDSVVEVALHSPVPIATGESLAAPGNFATLLRRGGVRIWQPDPMHLGGIWPTRAVIAMADASDIAVAPHSAAGPVCSAV
jgi:galactonate dehydratase